MRSSGSLRISEAASLAIHAMAVLAQRPERSLPVHELAQKLGASAHHLAKVAQRLARAGLAISLPGPTGGFRLARPASEVSLLQIYEAIEGPWPTEGCLLSQQVCSGADCLLGGMLQSIHRQVHDFFNKTSLADLAKRSGLLTIPAVASHGRESSARGATNGGLCDPSSN